MTSRFATVKSIGTIGRWWFPATVTLAALAALTATTLTQPAAAAAKATKAAKASPERTTEAIAPREAGELLMAIVSIKSQRVTFYDADGWVLRAPVSTGIKGRETPAGVFSVVQKNRDHRSNMYDDAWMPHMLRITWNGIALHGGPLPGHAASHGCVRMPFGFAERLFDRVPMGTRIIIAPGDAEPVEFSHPSLFVPNPEALAAAPARAEKLAREADEAAKIAKQAKSAAATAKRETSTLTASLRKLERLVKSADAEFVAAQKRVASAKGDQAKARAETQEQKAAARAAALRTQLDTANADAKPKLDAAAAAPEAARVAEKRRADTAKAAREARLATVPVSVFISRATQKLYIRRNTHEPIRDGGEMFDATFEIPIAIRNADQPIGTHVITAVASTNGALRWTALTVDGAGDAKGALDRITIPQEVLDRFGPTALSRSSIVISDEPLHRETNYRTEFVVALSHQPQGGLITRPRTPPEDRIVRNDDGGGFFGFGRRGDPAPTRRNDGQRGGPLFFQWSR